MRVQDARLVLGVEEGVSEDDLKRAYRKAALRTHPDKNKDDPHAKHKFQEVNSAFKRLNNPNATDSDSDADEWEDEDEAMFEMFDQFFGGVLGELGIDIDDLDEQTLAQLEKEGALDMLIGLGEEEEEEFAEMLAAMGGLPPGMLPPGLGPEDMMDMMMAGGGAGMPPELMAMMGGLMDGADFGRGRGRRGKGGGRGKKKKAKKGKRGSGAAGKPKQQKPPPAAASASAETAPAADFGVGAKVQLLRASADECLLPAETGTVTEDMGVFCRVRGPRGDVSIYSKSALTALG